jgi:hypothetical protein
MPLAKSLRDLLRIRQHHAPFLRCIPGCLGTAVGFRYDEKTGRIEGEDTKEGRKPAVLIFVIEKIPLASLPKEWRVPPRLEGPSNLWSHTDVIVGIPPADIVVASPSVGYNGSIVHQLNHTDVGVIGGIPILGPGSTGTAGVVVRANDQLAALTNYHVAGFVDTRIDRGGGVFEVLGTTSHSIFTAPVGTPNPNDLESYTNAKHRVDLGMIELTEETAAKAKPGVFAISAPLGPVFQLSLDRRDFDPLGRYVVGVGQTLGRQEGRIIAYGYEWRDSFTGAEWFATDYLIKGEGSLPFAAPGDSGKLVVTDDDARQPIALLWGGEQRFDSAIPAQQTLAYATEIGLALKLLDNAQIDW